LLVERLANWFHVGYAETTLELRHRWQKTLTAIFPVASGFARRWNMRQDYFKGRSAQLSYDQWQGKLWTAAWDTRAWFMAQSVGMGGPDM
jgi:hypothetical protein